MLRHILNTIYEINFGGALTLCNVGQCISQFVSRSVSLSVGQSFYQSVCQ